MVRTGSTHVNVLGSELFSKGLRKSTEGEFASGESGRGLVASSARGGVGEDEGSPSSTIIEALIRSRQSDQYASSISFNLEDSRCYVQRKRDTHSSFWNSRMLSFANANGPSTFVSVVLSRSSSVMFKKGFQIPAPVFQTVTRMGEEGNVALMDENTVEMEEAV